MSKYHAEQARKNELAFLDDYYQQLVGMKITSFRLTFDGDGILSGDGEPWPTIELEDETGAMYELEVHMDREGNGPGYLSGLPSPRKEAA